jgi:hypothetical protein
MAYCRATTQAHTFNYFSDRNVKKCPTAPCGVNGRQVFSTFDSVFTETTGSKRLHYYYYYYYYYYLLT